MNKAQRFDNKTYIQHVQKVLFNLHSMWTRLLAHIVSKPQQKRKIYFFFLVP